ncbi:Laminin subunit alpha-1 [Merluccius polli]|uniref:Laminin subunit alpha-1 n=1 Tax=Merluccius polli TaxID=89951 RepID=A0AA47N249_MERPO|nr:Laminin subunit alpha-1 [Merluccius polli]
MEVLRLLSAAGFLMLCASCVAAQQRGLFPAILNLASNAEVSSNATCGERQPEMFCKLVEHVPGRRIHNPQCRICDANSANERERHPISKAIDGTNSWWQSPSIKNGRQFHWITITLDLHQIFQVAYVIIKAANSPRPGNWILERSLDGVTFDPWQYYAISDTECLTRYNIPPRLGPPTYRSDQEVICTSYYSRLVPLEHGEIHTSLINGRPGADDLTPELLGFTSARFVRLRLQRIRTLNADLMTLSHTDPTEVDPIVTRRYYYSIKDISVGGMCICYGHAQSCPWDPVTKKLQCVCEHNTCGESCDECCPGYHQEPWQPGTITDGNTCQKCNCHNKADSCYYNQTVSDLRLSVNSQGVHQGGGVCVGCSQNTAGVNCENCARTFYRPAQVSPYSDSPCVACECDLRGAESAACAPDDTNTGVTAGQCVCKRGFAGQKCDRCAFGYRDFPSCSACSCQLSGSTNTDPCSPCTCKVNVMGENCDLCKSGFFNLQASDPEGCSHCFCFGVSDVCESSSWSISQTVHTNARLLPSPSLPDLHDNDLLPGNASSGPAHQHTMSWAAPNGFLGNRLASYGGLLNLSLFYDVPMDNYDRSIPAHCDIIIESYGKSLRQSSPRLLFLTPLVNQSVSMVMTPQKFVDVHGRVHVTRDDLLAVLTDVTALRVNVYLNTSASVGVARISLDIADPNSANRLEAVAVETCECPWGYSGTSCESCAAGFYRVGGVMFGGMCLQCECNDHATECDINGQCLGCTHNTSGPHCDGCLPGFYGDATEGTADDCQLCACPLLPPNSFSPTCVLEDSGSVSCDQCEEGYTGDRCERCADGFYGDPLVIGGVCKRCDCHGNVNVSEVGHCDAASGACLRCLYHTSGTHCNTCLPGYHGDAIHAKNCQECSCDSSGAVSRVCDVTTGRCDCRPNVTGLTCDQCQVGFYGITSGHGCSACNCSQSGSAAESCDEQGRCQCVQGVAGDKCDRCDHGYYNYTSSGCTACDCARTHGNCHSTTGDCICPPHTEGEECERCETGYWGHDPVRGCQSCDCSAAGSSAPQCELTNGECLCHPGFSGRSCDRCSPGHHGYPECQACGCDVAGTREDFCNQTLGVCDCRHTGTCVCKASVGGRGCSECVSGTFGLMSENPEGCSPCFCSGVSSVCEERGGLLHVPVGLGASPALLPVVSQFSLEGELTGVYQQGGDMLLDMRDLNTNKLAGPLYWRLPRQFEGNKLLSYGGLLSYEVVFYADDGIGLANHEPQILMRGGTLRKLVIYRDMVAPSNGIRTRHDIPLTEFSWRYFNAVSNRAVTHADFLSVLSNVQYLLIKSSYGRDLVQSRISNITMETALEEWSGATGGVARYIESCDCPPGYAGLSCQECAPGYYHQPLSSLSPQQRKTLVAPPCLPCACNHHSHTCDPHTGDCLSCQHHTSGPRCELCAAGYYGMVTGSINDCSLCACPLKDNSFSPTCVSEAMGDFRCNSCQPGYQGKYCERCSVGYYGNPSSAGGRCEACGCNVWGSLHAVCDDITGQCACRPGVRGQLCDQCEDRHILEGQHSCDDDCTGILLGDLDVLHNHLLSVNLSGISLAPFSQLVMLENKTIQVLGIPRPSHLSSLDEQLLQLTSDLSALLLQTTRLSDDVEEVGVSTSHKLTQGATLLETIATLQANILELQWEAGHMNNTQEAELQPTNHTGLLEEMASMLDAIRAVELSQHTAAQQHRLAESLLQTVQSGFQTSRASLESGVQQLDSALSTHTHNLQHTHTLLTHAAQQNNHTHTLLDNILTRYTQHKSVHHDVRSSEELVSVLLEQSQDLLSLILALGEHLHNTTAVLGEYSMETEQWRPLLGQHVDRLVSGLRTTDSLELVFSAERHAQNLLTQAHTLYRSLAAVYNISQNATGVFGANRTMTSYLVTALETAEYAFNLTVQSEVPLAERGREVLNSSSAVLQHSQLVNTTAQGLSSNMTQMTARLGLVSQGVRHVRLLLPQPISTLHSLNRSDVGEARHLISAIQTDLQQAVRRLDEMTSELENFSSVVERANHTTQHTKQLMTQSDGTANEVQRKMEEAELRTDRLLNRMKPLSMLGESMGRNLTDIRELIKQARRQAASIRVAVAADADCVRSYRPDVGSSNYNTLSLTFRTSSPDNLLFYMGSNTTVDFLAVEMHAGKVSVVWNVGSGVARLDYPHLQVTNNKWTRINVTRFGVHGSLSVQQLESGSGPLPVATARSPGPAHILEVDNNTVIHIGGMGQQSQRPSALRVSTFQGCMGEASLNEKNIGLWNYIRREGRCRGCFTSPQSEETSFQFDGSGFSVVQKALRSTSTSIVLLFKTLSPSGLLLYLASNATRDFLSMELVEGRFRLTFDLGSGALAMTSSKTYNSGVWTKITLQRTRRKGYLSIMAADQSSEKEVLEAESRGTASDLNRADLDPIYIGGLPASRPIRRQVVSRSFVGCIKNVEIARSNFDLLQDAYGVKKGCVLEAVRSVSVLKEGYVQLAVPSLGHEGQLFLTFSTRNSSGLLLAAFNNTPRAQFLLVVQLVPGGVRVELSLGGGASRRVEVKPRNGLFSDGLEHSLIISRTRKTLSVQVDEDHVASTPLSSGESSSLPPSSVFIGGLPLGEESRLPIRLQNASRSFRGCIQNLIVNHKYVSVCLSLCLSLCVSVCLSVSLSVCLSVSLSVMKCVLLTSCLNDRLVDLSGALRYDGVQLDSCLLEERTRGAVLPDDHEVEPTPDPSPSAVTPPTHLSAFMPQTLTCVSGEEPNFLPSTNQFGLTRNSHMTFNINPSTVRKGFVLELSLRTHADSGMVYLLSSNNMDYATLQLNGGRLLFTLDLGRGPISSSSAHLVNDGQWHTVRTEFAKRWVSMAIDGVTSHPVSVKGNQLDVDKTLYLGGVAHKHTWSSTNVTHSLPGCIQDVRLNGVRLKTPASQHNTTSCFTHTQTGSYFSGSGFAALLPEGYKVGSDMSVSLEIRTGQSEAVLLGISSSKVDAIGLEIIGRKVVFHVNNGAGRVSVESVSGVCDGRWHHLVATKSKNSLLLSVDGHTSITHNPYPQSTSAETNNPVYLGGYPSEVKQNSLSSSVSFRGCMKKMKLIKGHVTKILDLSSAFLLSGFVVFVITPASLGAVHHQSPTPSLTWCSPPPVPYFQPHLVQSTTSPLLPASLGTVHQSPTSSLTWYSPPVPYFQPHLVQSTTSPLFPASLGTVHQSPTSSLTWYSPPPVPYFQPHSVQSTTSPLLPASLGAVHHQSPTSSLTRCGPPVPYSQPHSVQSTTSPLLPASLGTVHHQSPTSSLTWYSPPVPYFQPHSVQSTTSPLLPASLGTVHQSPTSSLTRYSPPPVPYFQPHLVQSTTSPLLPASLGAVHHQSPTSSLTWYSPPVDTPTCD